MRQLDTAYLPDTLREHRLTVAVWPARELPDEYLDQLIEKSREPHILEYETQGTKKPSRFLDRETYRAWAARRERIIYLLLHESDREPLEVAGVIWFGPKACPLGEPEFARYDVTFSIRLYESSRGKGLSRPFIEAAHADVLEHYYPGHDLWLDTGKDNEAAHRSYLKFGYQVLGEHGDRIVMGYSA